MNINHDVSAFVIPKELEREGVRVIRVLIVDDSQLIRETLSAILSQHPEFVVIAEASNGWDATDKARQFQPDVVLLDIGMPELNGFQAAPLIKNAAPATAILVVTQHNNPFFIRQAFAVGALGFLEKGDAAIELHTAVNHVFSKKTFVSKSLQPPTIAPSENETV